MKLMRMTTAFGRLAVLSTALVASPAPAQQANEQFIPLLVYRTGPYAPTGIPNWNGMVDYLDAREPT